MRLSRSQVRDIKNVLAVCFEPDITRDDVRKDKNAWLGADIPGRARITRATRAISRLLGSIDPSIEAEENFMELRNRLTSMKGREALLAARAKKGSYKQGVCEGSVLGLQTAIGLIDRIRAR